MTPEQAVALGERWYDHGWLDAAVEYWQRVISMVCDPGLMVSAWDGIARVAARRGRWDEALAAFDQALAVLPSRADSEWTMRLAMHQALVWAQQGQTDSAYRQLWALAQQARTFTSPELRARIGLNLAAVQIDYEYYAQAIATLHSVATDWTPEDQMRYRYFWATNLGVCHVALRQWDEATQYLDLALSVATTEDRAVPVLVERAILAFHRGDTAGSVAEAQRALRIMWRHWLAIEPDELARLSTVLARIAEAFGESFLARRFEDMAQTLYGQLGRWQAWHRMRSIEDPSFLRRFPAKDSAMIDELRRAVQWLETLFALDIVWPQASYITEVRNHAAQAIAARLQWPTVRRNDLASACRLADVGLTAIDPLARDHPRRSPAAWQQYRQHPWLSCQLLAPLGLDARVLETIAHHHEQPDGQGFPEGRTAPDIPESAAIYAVADVYAQGTLTEGHTATWSRMQDLAGSQLDARWVGVLLEIFASVNSEG
ncbi:putative metal dependent phosphohydrolase [Sulfobacillus acidophilus DSM 10332]|uniref:Metal dependent phosphohydrolase n=1 Tax=Sulfobacillus acidophilus (strain ATCC 700253 / DSM 10332 / NAL) TaxID=679936 RepID=G8U109_SULAD|nr:putative metal dependent phosphohydrolase [Sulfobacillus acidophilus DSM 10332]